jgi:PIN domain nuclease of toxin-antitoxin system
MKLLLDTHIWLWSALQPDRLTRPVSKALAHPENELWLSAVSVWELTVLCRKGRFRLPVELSDWVPKSMQDLEVSEAPLTIEVALAVSSMKLPHGDPADHFIAASAKVFGLTLVTADRNLLEAPGIQLLANR